MLSDIDKKIIEMLNNGASLEEMLEETNLYHSQLALKLKKIKDNGYLIQRELINKGLKYSLKKDNIVNNKIEIDIPNGFFKFLVISDTHICRINERLDLLKKLYEYASNKNFNHIFHLGDLIDSAHKKDMNHINQKTTHEQVEYLIKKYPKYNSIATSILLGNHDYRSIEREGIDISNIIENRRLDIKILGYEKALLKLNNRYIALSHPFKFNDEIMKIPQNILDGYPNINPDITFIGHLHKSAIYQNDNNIIINVPQFIDNPEFIDNLSFIGGFECGLYSNNSDRIFDTFIIKPLMLEPTIKSVTTIKYNLPKILEKNLTQTEKFNQKYKR